MRRLLRGFSGRIPIEPQLLFELISLSSSKRNIRHIDQGTIQSQVQLS